MEYFLGRPAAWWLEVSHVLFAERIGNAKELKDRLVVRRQDGIQLTADEADYYFGMQSDSIEQQIILTVPSRPRHEHFGVIEDL